MQISNSYTSLSTQLNEATKTLGEIEKLNEKKKAELEKESDSSSRETFGLPLLENISDEEYEAFVRATKGLESSQVERAGQTLQLVSASYDHAQKLINGGLLMALSGEFDSAGLMSDLRSFDIQKIINEGIDVLKNMNETDQRFSVKMLERMAMALNEKSIDLQG